MPDGQNFGVDSLAADSVGASEILTDGVGAAEIAASAVGTSEVNDNTLTAADLATSAFTSTWTEYKDPQQCMHTATTAGVLTRNAQGDYSINRTAGGAETVRFAVTVPRLRTTAGTGLRLDAVAAFYEIAVADATSVDLLVDALTLVQATEPAVATHGGTIIDGSYDGAHDTATERADKDVTGGEHVLVLNMPTAAYNVTQDVMVVVEFTAVLANTGTIKFRGFGLRYTEIDEGT